MISVARMWSTPCSCYRHFAARTSELCLHLFCTPMSTSPRTCTGLLSTAMRNFGSSNGHFTTVFSSSRSGGGSHKQLLHADVFPEHPTHDRDPRSSTSIHHRQEKRREAGGKPPQENLRPVPPSLSRSTIHYPFSTDSFLREDYRNPGGLVRVRRKRGEQFRGHACSCGRQVEGSGGRGGTGRTVFARN